jgi:predicted dinucleotide-binding enzyme
MTLSTVVFRSLLAGAAVVAAALTAPAVCADTIALIGTGRVAGALGPRFVEQGHDIIYGSRDPSRQEVRELVARTGREASAAGPAEAAAQADIVVIAVPGGVAEEVVRGLGDLSGKIIIDPTNRVDEGADGYRVHAVATSNGELIQALAPDARVVKAFNTLNYRTMADPGEAGGPVTIPLAGNDADAKATVAALVEGMGLEPIDLGPIRYAHVLEGMLVVWVNARIQGTPFEFHLRRREVD